MFANVGLVKTCIAASAIAENRIVAFDAVYGHMGESAVVQAETANGKFAGIAGLPKGVSALIGEPIDVIKSGIADVLYGGDVEAGDFVTSDAQGRAVVAEDGDNIIGVAQYAGSENELGGVLIQWGSLRLSSDSNSAPDINFFNSRASSITFDTLNGLGGLQGEFKVDGRIVFNGVFENGLSEALTQLFGTGLEINVEESFFYISHSTSSPKLIEITLTDGAVPPLATTMGYEPAIFISPDRAYAIFGLVQPL